MKTPFDAIVRENTDWLLAFMRRLCRNSAVAEDLTQEVWLRAWRAYDGYAETGHLRPWLARIARNVLNSYYHSANRHDAPLSLDAENDDGDPLYGTLPDESVSPEDELVRRELVERVQQTLASMPTKQRQLLVWRYFDEVSVIDTAARMGVPPGTVKSRTHYALETLRKRLGAQLHQQKGEKIMDCREARKYLFMYAKGVYKNSALDTHLAGCAECRAAADALTKLVPTMTFARDDEMSHFLIHFPNLHLSYCGMSHEVENYQWMNEQLVGWNHRIPEDRCWFGGGFGKINQLAALFDMDGRELPFITWEENNGKYYRYKPTELYRIAPCTWDYTVYTCEDSDSDGIRRSKEAPNLYYGSLRNSLGNAAKSALYHAVPAEAENIRIKRGNGVIDCGAYKFAYTDRYITEDECIALEYSFLLN